MNKNFYKDNRYKLIISLVFGVLGFVVNFASIEIYEYHDISINILLGLFFPLLISVVWGWKYGLISALFGGCQTMWITWYFDGYGVLYSVPIFTLWVVFHGIISDINKKSVEKKWYFNKYFVELIFRVLLAVGFFTVFRFLVSNNPPVWNENIINTTVSRQWLVSVCTKHLIEGYALLVLTELALRMNLVRKILRIERRSKDTSYIIINSIIAGAIVWILDAVVLTISGSDYGREFIDNLFLNIEPNDLLLRIIIFTMFFITGVIYSDFTEKRNEGKRELQKQYNSIRSILYLTSDIEKATEVDESAFLSDLLSTAIEIIPEADYGAAYIYESDFMKPVAVSGYDKLPSPDVKIYYKTIFQYFEDDTVVLISDYGEIINNTKDINTKEKIKMLAEEIKETMFIIIKLNGKENASISLSIDKCSDKCFSEESKELARLLNSIPSAFYALLKDYELKQAMHKDMITSIIKMLSLHNLYTKEHSTEVARISAMLAEEMGMDNDAVDKVYWSGLVHDIGKILISEEILNKPTKLTEDEFAMIKKHPVWGFETLNSNESLSNIANYVLYHHERWDGRGYPDGLSGEEIPLISRIIAIADTYDAMTSDRAYRKALDKEIAIQEITKNSGTQFDPKMADVFQSIAYKI